MIATLALLTSWARADEPPTSIDVAPRALLWSLPGGVVQATRRAVPAGRPGTHAIACRTTFRWDGAARSAVVDACPEALVPGVRAAAEAWVFDVSGEVSGAAIDVWTVFRPDGTVGTFLAPSPVGVTVRDPGVDALAWQLVAMRPPLHPDGSEKGKPGVAPGATVVCTANLLSDEVGNVEQVAVTGCDEAFAARVREALDSWRIAPHVEGDDTLPVSATIEVTFEPAFDGAPPTVSWVNPLPPDLGDRPAPKAEEVPEGRAPTTPAVLVVHRAPYAEVRVHAIGWPAPLPAEASASCDLLLQVNSKFRVWVWPERCDAAVLPAVEAAARDWVLSPGDAAPGERFARFRGTFLFEGGEVRLLVTDRDVISEALPERVGTWSPAKATLRIAPKLPKGETVPDGGLVCEIDAVVTVRGKSAVLVPVAEGDHACPEAFMASARKAVSKWQWTPARADGVDVQSTQRVSVQFKG